MVIKEQDEADDQSNHRKNMMAKAATKPAFLAANSITHYNRVLGKLDLMAVVDELGSQINGIKNGGMERAEEVLASQAAVLDTLFNSLAIKALQAPGLDMQAVVLKLALQAQKQCCQTYEVLAAIKNPQAVTTVLRQTNIGQSVQVNNGSTDNISKLDLENELLEYSHGKGMDIGTQGSASTVNQDLAAMEKLDRPKKRSRQGYCVTQF